MTVSNTNTKDKFTTNGVTVDFPFTFYLTETAQVFVKLVDDQDVETDYTNFTVIKNPDNNGGTLTTNDVLNNTDILIFRDTAQTQETDYIPGGRFPAESHEAALDKLTLQVQELQEEIDRTVRSSIGVDDPITLEELNESIDQRDADTLQSANDFTYSREVIDNKDDDVRALAAQDTADYSYSKSESHQIFEVKAPVNTQSYVQRGGQWVPITGVPFFRVGCGESYMECGEPEAISGDFDFLYPQGFTPNS